jgi:hypothetical protein
VFHFISGPTRTRRFGTRACSRSTEGLRYLVYPSASQVESSLRLGPEEGLLAPPQGFRVVVMTARDPDSPYFSLAFTWFL